VISGFRLRFRVSALKVGLLSLLFPALYATAIIVSAYPEAPLRDFNFSDIYIEAKSAGSMQNADGWTFVKTLIQALDGSHVAVKDSRNLKGLD
jgi:hypothetical protein